MSRNNDMRRSWAHYCSYCGTRLCNNHRKGGVPNCPDEATWDHLVPGNNGKGVMGRHKVVACHWCNNDRGGRTVPKWFKSIRHRWESGDFAGAPQEVKNKAASVYLAVRDRW